MPRPIQLVPLLDMEGIVQHVDTTLDPRAAIHHSNGSRDALCSTVVFDKYRGDDGETIPLAHICKDAKGISRRVYLKNGVDVVTSMSPLSPANEELYNEKKHGIKKYACIYIRVSSIRQGEDGFSIEDQVRRGIGRAIHAGHAFRIFSDKGLSGTLPPYNLELIAKMITRSIKARTDVFNVVFFDEFAKKHPMLDEERKEGIRLHLNRWTAKMHAYVKEIKALDAKTILDNKAVDLSFLASSGLDFSNITNNNITAETQEVNETITGDIPDLSDVEIEEEFYLEGADVPRKMKHQNRTRSNKAIMYRPGMTVLLNNIEQIHTMYVGDNSRLTRSPPIYDLLVERFFDVGLTVVGTCSDMSAMNDDKSLGAQVVRTVLSHVAAYTLAEIITNSTRGIVTRILNGRHHGRLPAWVSEKENGDTYLNDHANLIREIIDRYLGRNGFEPESISAISRRLTKGAYSTPKGNVIWSAHYIGFILRSETLYGAQNIYGLDWPTLPAVITREEWDAVQKKRLERAQEFCSDSTSKANHFGAGLVRCSCGQMLQFRHRVDEHNQYWCRTYTTGKKPGDTIRHTVLSVEDFDGFLDNLMTKGFSALMHELKEESAVSDIRAHLQQLEDTAQREKRRLAEEMDALKKQAIEDARIIKKEHVLPIVESILQNLIIENTVLQETQQNIQQAEADIAAFHARQEAMLNSEALSELEEEGKGWNIMYPDQKRHFLLKMFEPFRVTGNPPNETLVIRFRTLRKTELDPIPFITKQKGQEPGRITYTRRLMDYEMWREIAEHTALQDDGSSPLNANS